MLLLYRLNILVLGGDTGFAELYAYGMYKIAALTGVCGLFVFYLFLNPLMDDINELYLVVFTYKLIASKIFYDTNIKVKYLEFINGKTV